MLRPGPVYCAGCEEGEREEGEAATATKPPHPAGRAAQPAPSLARPRLTGAASRQVRHHLTSDLAFQTGDKVIFTKFH